MPQSVSYSVPAKPEWLPVVLDEKRVHPSCLYYPPVTTPPSLWLSIPCPLLAIPGAEAAAGSMQPSAVQTEVPWLCMVLGIFTYCSSADCLTANFNEFYPRNPPLTACQKMATSWINYKVKLNFIT